MLLSRFSKRFGLLWMMLLALSLGSAHATRVPHKRDTRAEVLAVDKLWRNAELANDTAAMDRLLSDDYVGVTVAGRVVTKSQQLDRMRTRQSQITRLDESDVKIKLVGAVAIVTSMTDVEGTFDGRPTHGQFRSIRVYQRMPAGSWKIINFEATPMRGPHGPRGAGAPPPAGESAPPPPAPAAAEPH